MFFFCDCDCCDCDTKIPAVKKCHVPKYEPKRWSVLEHIGAPRPKRKRPCLTQVGSVGRWHDGMMAPRNAGTLTWIIFIPGVKKIKYIYKKKVQTMVFGCIWWIPRIPLQSTLRVSQCQAIISFTIGSWGIFPT